MPMASKYPAWTRLLTPSPVLTSKCGIFEYLETLMRRSGFEFVFHSRCDSGIILFELFLMIPFPSWILTRFWAPWYPWHPGSPPGPAPLSDHENVIRPSVLLGPAFLLHKLVSSCTISKKRSLIIDVLLDELLHFWTPPPITNVHGENQYSRIFFVTPVSHSHSTVFHKKTWNRQLMLTREPWWDVQLPLPSFFGTKTSEGRNFWDKIWLLACSCFSQNSWQYFLKKFTTPGF